ncbi:MAG: hypothetical protein J0L70_30945 [Leptolyngbya sp. UWPOB_LEPTO1]|uniref:hypothetical protein n=1 Tax=Leptolyngbya sp. UWPOB_LEPTO1 TaxID=2815653 RepID=UPI001AC67F95|nr:hypothetical protein [Leptolyngbya sp. UWPOB_LEPTO1]MBN8564934.1 hypothetical protein [Leptolyngbya sp. UWPOB_LEPTO1]
MEEFLALENSDDSLDSERDLTSDRERIRHLLIGSPQAVKRTIHLLHSLGYAEAGLWSKPQIAGSLGQPGEVVSILIRNVLTK